MSIYDFEVTTIDGRKQSMAEYRGKTLLIVNVASRCGFTAQYAGLQALYRDLQDRGFVVMGFPCNQFLFEEPGLEADIQRFCTTTYNVTFPMFAYLKNQRRGWLGTKAIKWNFTKFLVDSSGAVVKRYGPTATPERIRADLAGL